MCVCVVESFGALSTGEGDGTNLGRPQAVIFHLEAQSATTSGANDFEPCRGISASLGFWNQWLLLASCCNQGHETVVEGKNSYRQIDQWGRLI